MDVYDNTVNIEMFLDRFVDCIQCCQENSREILMTLLPIVGFVNNRFCFFVRNGL